MTKNAKTESTSNSLNLSQDEWIVILNTFCGVTRTPAGRCKGHLCTAIIGDRGLDEMPDYDPWTDKFMAPFFSLTESEAMAALEANNNYWTAGREPWNGGAESVSER